MFPVPRYDPNAEAKESKRHNKKKTKRHNVSSPSSSRKQEPSPPPRGGNTNSNNEEGQHCHDDVGRSRRQEDAAAGLSPQHATGTSERVESDRKTKKRRSAVAQTEEAIDDMDLEFPADTADDDAWDGPAGHDGGGLVHCDPVTLEVDIEDEEEATDGARPDVVVAAAAAATPNKKAPSTHQKDLKRAEEMSNKSIEEAARQWKLAPFLVQHLIEAGYKNFFPIQALVIPFALYQHRVHASSTSGLRCRDVCVAAATGSGKTLAYVIPVLQALHESSGCLGNVLRALVVLPSRDLARQVHAVFEQFVKGSNLKVGLAVGQTSFEGEQRDLLSRGDDDADGEAEKCNGIADLYVSSDGMYAHNPRRRKRLELEPGNARLVLDTFWDGGQWDDDFHLHHRCGVDDGTSGRSPRPSIAVDILVCTPGRLVDHIEHGTMTLEHLRYLVVDEADRLLAQRYHSWIDKVLREATARRNPPPTNLARRRKRKSRDEFYEFEELDPCRYLIEPITWRHESNESFRLPVSSESTSTIDANDAYDDSRNRVAQPIQLQKFLVSATLTRDPQKLATLHLNHPIHFSLQARPEERRYALPPNLHECTVMCTSEQKPLALIAILLDRLQRHREAPDGRQQIVIFTSSVDAAHRLARLLQLLWSAGIARIVQTAAGQAPGPDAASALHAVAEVSSSSSSMLPQERAARLRSRSILVCSDGLSRGMDLPNVSLVVHYDVPSLAKTYVHRCGRTARAGQSGTAIVLLRAGEQAAFAKMRSLIVGGGSSVEAMPIPKSNLLRDAIPLYRKCLVALRTVLRAEDEGELGLTEEDRLHEYLLDAESEHE